MAHCGSKDLSSAPFDASSSKYPRNSCCEPPNDLFPSFFRIFFYFAIFAIAEESTYPLGTAAARRIEVRDGVCNSDAGGAGCMLLDCLAVFRDYGIRTYCTSFHSLLTHSLTHLSSLTHSFLLSNYLFHRKLLHTLIEMQQVGMKWSFSEN